jgi:hypothetical protein
MPQNEFASLPIRRLFDRKALPLLAGAAVWLAFPLCAQNVMPASASPLAFATIAAESSPLLGVNHFESMSRADFSNSAGSINSVGSVNPSGSVDSFGSTLPEDPSALVQNAPLRTSTVPAADAKSEPVASIYTKYVPAGYRGQPLTARDKVILGARDLYAPFSILSMITTAGYSQVLNGEPNYGTDRGAFGERLGAAGIRDTSEGIFTDMVFSPLLHQDPRYYVEGPGHNFFHRLIYSATRPLITRTDGGRETVNASLMLGYAGASALSYTYYPKINQNFHDTASTFGGSIGGAAFGDVVSEFSDQFLQAIHLKKRQ